MGADADETVRSNVPDLANQLWTTRYAPQTLKEVCGNKAAVDKLLEWLNEWYVVAISVLQSSA